MTRKILIFMALVAVTAGCGGTWEDDPKNWERAFGEAKPEGVEVLKSKFWKSTHWSYEVVWFFKLKSSASLKNRLIIERNLRRLTEKESAKEGYDSSDLRPGWFPPKTGTRYELWRNPNEMWPTFKLIVDSETGDIFISDSQL